MRIRTGVRCVAITAAVAVALIVSSCATSPETDRVANIDEASPTLTRDSPTAVPARTESDSGGEETAPTSAPESNPGPDGDALADEVASTSEELIGDESSPIMDAIGVDFGVFDDADLEQSEQDRQFEIQACMQDFGFEYTPLNIDFGGSANYPDAESGTRAYVERYGYGITAATEADLASVGRIPAFVDPNADYVNALPEAARRAYDEALYGPQLLGDLVDPETGVPIDPNTGEPFTEEQTNEALRTIQEQACIFAGNAFSSGGEDEEILAAFSEQFGDVREEIDERVNNDPRMTQVEDDWVRCMIQQSFPFADRAEPRTEVASRIDPLFWQVYETGTGDIPPEVQAGIERIRAYEISVATADFACSEGHDELRRNVRAEYEQRFVDENQGAIVAMLEAISR